MIPPTSIDGTDITGATIDGTDVQEITVDGDVVFSAGPRPVAFSDMIAWYPMESNIAGGDEYSDATALFSGAADSTAYDLIDDGAVFDQTFGVTDINEGANSGSFENQNGSQFLTSNVPLSIPATISFWYYREGGKRPLGSFQDNDYIYYFVDAGQTGWFFENGSPIIQNLAPFNEWVHSAISITSGGNATFVYDRDTTLTGNVSEIGGQLKILKFGGYPISDFQGYIDDVRIYNSALSVSQIQQIYDNTEP
jgi:hypothetical protein